jgi:hypothetical protein
MWNDFPSFLKCIFYIFASSLLANSHILRSVRWQPTEPRTVTHARDHWWTLDFANAFVSPGVNSRAELVPSPRAYAQNDAPRRWLGDNELWFLLIISNESNTLCASQWACITDTFQIHQFSWKWISDYHILTFLLFVRLFVYTIKWKTSHCSGLW